MLPLVICIQGFGLAVMKMEAKKAKSLLRPKSGMIMIMMLSYFI